MLFLFLMTDENEIVEAPESHDLLVFFNDIIESLAGKVDLGIGVTLTVNGMLVSGQIISRDEWLAEVSDNFSKTSLDWRDAADTSETTKADAEKTIMGGFQKVVDNLREMYKETSLKGWIYLKDADLILFPSGSNVIKMPLWCIPIEKVDGFSLGNIGFK